MRQLLFVALLLFLPLQADGAAPSPDAGPQPHDPLSLGIRFFQTVVSPVDGPRCSMYPTCSAYAAEAAKTHGFFLGVLLTVDRLLHEVEPEYRSKPIRVGNRLRFADPLADNTFWWQPDSGKETESP